jgi:hypothetical protein
VQEVVAGFLFWIDPVGVLQRRTHTFLRFAPVRAAITCW